MKQLLTVLLLTLFSFACEKKEQIHLLQQEEDFTIEKAWEIIPQVPLDVFGFRDDTGFGSFRPETVKYFIQLDWDYISAASYRDEHAVIRTNVIGTIPFYRDYDKRFYLIVYPVLTIDGYQLYKEVVLEGEYTFQHSPRFPSAFVGDHFARFTFHTKEEWDNPDAYVVTACEFKIN